MDIFEIAQRAEGQTVKYHSGSCLRNFKNNSCQKCVKVCAQKALAVNSGNIAFKKDECDSCGLCLTVCPTECFKTEPRILKSVGKQLKTNPQAIFCCEASEQENAITVSCPAALSVGTLVFSALKTGAATVVFDNCDDCSIAKKSTAIVVKNVTQANNILQRLGKKAQVTILEKPVVVENKISRNQFFKSIGTELIDVSVGSLSNKESERDFLLKMLENRKIKSNGISELPFFQLEIKDSCDHCLKCTKICTSKALFAQANEKIFSLRFKMNGCNGCGLCIDACPKKSIAITNKADLSLLFKDQNLKETQAIYCPDCGDPFSRERESCDKCAKNKKLNKNITSVFK